MATIEERAKAEVRDWYNCNYPCSSYNECIFGNGSNAAYDCEECGADEFNNGYLKGATEQHKIDIEKACEAYCKTCDTKECEDFGCEYCCDWVEKFRKAMEK